MQLQGTVYIDSIFLLNFILDLYLLKLTAAILRKTAKNRRILAGSLTGAVGYCLSLLCLPEMSGTGKVLLFMLPTQMLMIKAAYGTKGLRTILRETGWMLVLAFLLGGFMLFMRSRLPFEREIRNSFPVTAGLGTLGYGLIRRGICIYRRKTENCCCQVSIRTDEGIRTVNALIDTGNGLREPVSGRPVAILDGEVWESMKLWRRPEKYKIVPYHSLGRKNGLLEAYEVDSIRIKGSKGEKEYKRVILALYEGKVSGKGRYQMILPPELSI